jgi:hypothetical protein
VSAWNHAICSRCWYGRHPNRQPVRVEGAEREKCCFCGHVTTSGIYVRDEPRNCLTKGRHDEEATTPESDRKAGR